MKQTIKFSKNKKLNTVLSSIYNDLMDLGIEEVKRYKQEFKYATDYNIVQYGNMLVYYDEVRDFYAKAGYKTIPTWSDQKVWETYLRQVGYIARRYFK